MSKITKISAIFTVVAASLIALIFYMNLSNCSSGNCTEAKWGYTMGTFDRYNVVADHKTDAGIAYDPSGMNISGDLIDRVTNEVESCLMDVFPDHTLTESVIAGSFCKSDHASLILPIDRNSFNVKVASDWLLSCDGTQQLLPVETYASGCIEKGLLPTDECPCRWRAGIKCPNTLITTPSFYLYKDVLIRLLTGCEDPWGSPELFKCATPSTDALGNGTK